MPEGPSGLNSGGIQRRPCSIGHGGLFRGSATSRTWSYRSSVGVSDVFDVDSHLTRPGVGLDDVDDDLVGLPLTSHRLRVGDFLDPGERPVADLSATGFVLALVLGEQRVAVLGYLRNIGIGDGVKVAGEVEGWPSNPSRRSSLRCSPSDLPAPGKSLFPRRR
jgi:hypothetical protein